MSFAQPEPLTRAKRAQYTSLLREGDHLTSGATLSKAEQYLKEVECQVQLHDRIIEEKTEEKMSAIRRIDAEILLLENQRKSWTIQQEKCKLYFSSIRKLPDDVLSLIFANFVQACARHAVPLPELTNSRMLNVPALKLAHVCAHWRTISERSKSLWGTLFVRTPERGQYSSEITKFVKNNLARRIREIIAFSEEVPLDFVYCDVDDSDFPPDPAHTMAIIQSFIDVSHRWRDVSLYIPSLDEGGLRNQLETMHSRLPLLRSLTIHLEYDKENRPPCNAFQIAPNLRNLYFHSALVDSTHDTFPLSQLESVVSWFVPSKKYFDALSSAPNLHTIEVHLETLECYGQRALSYCPAVQKLVVHSARESAPTMWELDSVSVFDKFTLPALQELHIIASSGTDTIPDENFDEFLRRSKCALTHLSLVDISFDSYDLILFLRHAVPQLKVLHFTQLFPYEKKNQKYESINHRFFDELCVEGEERDQLLPMLTELSLTLNARIMDSSSWDSLLRMVSSRWRPSLAEEDGIACLKTLILHFPGTKWKAQRLDPLRTLAAAGMSVIVKDSTGHLDI